MKFIELNKRDVSISNNYVSNTIKEVLFIIDDITENNCVNQRSSSLNSQHVAKLKWQWVWQLGLKGRGDARLWSKVLKLAPPFLKHSRCKPFVRLTDEVDSQGELLALSDVNPSILSEICLKLQCVTNPPSKGRV